MKCVCSCTFKGKLHVYESFRLHSYCTAFLVCTPVNNPALSLHFTKPEQKAEAKPK